MNAIFYALTVTVLMGLFTFLTFIVISKRRTLKVAYKTSHQDRHFQAATSAHRNFVDYTPIGLILLYIIGHQELISVWYAILCLLLILGRCIHAYGLLYGEHLTRPNFKFRVYGMSLTLCSLWLSSLSLLYLAIMT